MKTKVFKIVLFSICVLQFSFCIKTYAQENVGIGTTNPDPSAILDLTAADKGILIPRMTIAQRNAIASPATGLMIYQIDSTPGFYYWDGAQWVQAIGPTGATGPTGADSTVPGPTGATGPTGANGTTVLGGTGSTTAIITIRNGTLFQNQINEGLTVKSPDGNCWIISVDNTGKITTQSVVCP